MSTSSVLKRNKKNLFSEVEDSLMSQVNDMYIKEKFLVGNTLDKIKLSHTLLIYNILDSCSSEISKYIMQQLAFKNDCNHRDSLCETIEVCKDTTCCEIGQESVLGTTDW